MLFWEPFIWSTFFLFDSCYFVTLQYISVFVLCGYFLFFLGIIGIIIRQISLIFILISVELMFLGINFVFLMLSFLILQPFLQIFVIILLCLSAAETAIILSFIFVYHRLFFETEKVLLRFFVI